VATHRKELAKKKAPPKRVGQFDAALPGYESAAGEPVTPRGPFAAAN
jgi:hypothetical protein